MNAVTKLSAKGQVVIPKAMRDELRLTPGQTLDVIRTAGGVLLRPTGGGSDRSFDAVMADIRKITRRYRGPAVSIEQMNRTIEEGWAKRGSRGGV